ncbi:MAG: hypothetical protein KGI75_19075 [Rhizobiaceae bacterium]|nr:hypothetical protein [Rhizobiaceae bacterium]
MSFGGILGRIAIQLLLSVAVIAFNGGGILFMFVIVCGVPCAFISMLVFAPIEYIASRFRVRWLALILIPLLAAALPWTRYFSVQDHRNFFAAIGGLTWISGLFGLSWSASSLLVLWLAQPPLPDERMFG